MALDLVGYLLNALEPAERDAVEAQLRTNPAAREQLQELEQALVPLAWDAEVDLPSGLVDRTLAQLPLEKPSLAVGWPRRRLAEFAVAAALLLTVTGLVAAWVGRLHGLRDQDGGVIRLVECRDNLQKLFVPLRTYADAHGGHFPNVAVAAESPRNNGLLVYPLLQDSKLLPTDVGYGKGGAGLKEIQAMDAAAYQAWAEKMKGYYAYSLGHKVGGQIVSLKIHEGTPTSLLPLMADMPPANAALGNSPFHGGSGQHVLYADGHVTFAQARDVGFERDDIYVNRGGLVAAGHDWKDAVLSAGAIAP